MNIFILWESWLFHKIKRREKVRNRWRKNAIKHVAALRKKTWPIDFHFDFACYGIFTSRYFSPWRHCELNVRLIIIVNRQHSLTQILVAINIFWKKTSSWRSNVINAFYSFREFSLFPDEKFMIVIMRKQLAESNPKFTFDYFSMTFAFVARLRDSCWISQQSRLNRPDRNEGNYSNFESQTFLNVIGNRYTINWFSNDSSRQPFISNVE